MFQATFVFSKDNIKTLKEKKAREVKKNKRNKTQINSIKKGIKQNNLEVNRYNTKIKNTQKSINIISNELLQGEKILNQLNDKIVINNKLIADNISILSKIYLSQNFLLLSENIVENIIISKEIIRSIYNKVSSIKKENINLKQFMGNYGVTEIKELGNGNVLQKLYKKFDKDITII